MRALLDSANVRTDRPCAEAGLLMLESGGEFADGALAQAGYQMGAEHFVSFDRQAVRLLQGAGFSAREV